MKSHRGKALAVFCFQNSHDADGRRSQIVKTARFATVVERLGKPEIHLALLDPKKDRSLQAAVKANRVMTIMQPSAGAKADRGEVGFDPGTGRQFLIFPKSLRPFARHTVVGIKYDLIESKEVPKRERVVPGPPKPKKPRGTAKNRKKTHTKVESNVIAFKPRHGDDEDTDEEGDSADQLKGQVRRAMKLLEDGKAVAAFNLLKRIVDE